jgi:hypothetical protein
MQAFSEAQQPLFRALEALPDPSGKSFFGFFVAALGGWTCPALVDG